MINILIVDDSATDTLILKNLFESEKDLRVIACAKDGLEAIELVEKLKPDLITMDIQMPVMNGYDATKIIMERFPTPVVVISSYLSKEGENATFNALESGALTVLHKPTNITSEAFKKTAKNIIDTIRSMAEIQVIRRSNFIKKPDSAVKSKEQNEFKLIVIGASVGGPHALKTILANLPENFPLPIVVVQHMTHGFIHGFVGWLGTHVKIRVKCAQSNERLMPGVVYFAPDGAHLLIKDFMGSMHLLLEPGENIEGFCPSISALFKSLSPSHSKNSIAILLTGMGTDGVEGMVELKAKGAHTLIQSESTCVVFGMAGVAKTLNVVDREIDLEQISEYLQRILSQKTK